MPEPEGEFAHVFGTVHDKEGKPLAGATVDVWHDAPDGCESYYMLQPAVECGDSQIGVWLHSL